MTPKEIYEHHVAEAAKQGKPRAEQNAYGLRMLNHAGFYEGPGGWKQLHSDLRKKVNVREAFPQRDGTFCIYDVDCFYPNAVKSMPDEKGKRQIEVYTADDIRKIIENTNYAIEHEGGQKPGILEGHPNILQAGAGMQMDVHGFGIRWRESPRGDGWARCDLVSVDPEYVDRLKKKKLTGISAYIAEDTDKTNRRFGHVALLGGSTQALSHLPTHDVYTACCFSADAAFFQGEPQMLSDKHKKCFAAMKSAMDGYSAAEASFATKEPGADMKVKQAMGNCFSAYAAMKGAFDDGGGMDDGTGSMAPTQDVPEQFSADGQRKELPTEAGLSLTEQNEPQQMEFSAGGFDIGAFDESAVTQLSSQFASGHVKEAFTTSLNVIKHIASQFKARDKQHSEQLRKVQMANQMLQGNAIREDYRTFCAGLRNEGFQFDAETENSMFSLAMSAPDKLKALQNAKAMLRKMPKAESLAGLGQISSQFDNRAPDLRTGKLTLSQDDINEMERATGRSFSDIDLAFGASLSPDVMTGNIR